jgi:hypothetical protein
MASSGHVTSGDVTSGHAQWSNPPIEAEEATGKKINSVTKNDV